MNRVVVEHLAKHYRLYRSPGERLRSALLRTGAGVSFPSLRDVTSKNPCRDFPTDFRTLPRGGAARRAP